MIETGALGGFPVLRFPDAQTATFLFRGEIATTTCMQIDTAQLASMTTPPEPPGLAGFASYSYLPLRKSVDEIQ